jgi:DNA modification methylase
MKVLDQAHGKNWTLYNADSVELLPALPANSVHLSVFSPPFLSLFTYSASERDLGNSRTPAQFWRHFRFLIDDLMRVTVPGRLACVHVAQVATTKTMHGRIGFIDFRGLTIRAFERRGWIYHGEAAIDKNPQAQAIRTHAKGLLFVQLRKDSAAMRPGLADYVLFFRKPGENPIPVAPDITNEDWIEWAGPIWKMADSEADALLYADALDLIPQGPLFWYGIEESDTLNVAEGRDPDDEKHLCPLQIGTINRCVRLFSNAGEVVLSLFAGIGSEGYSAIKHGRRFVGSELKQRYFAVAASNLRRAEREMARADMFAFEAEGVAS